LDPDPPRQGDHPVIPFPPGKGGKGIPPLNPESGQPAITRLEAVDFHHT